MPTVQVHRHAAEDLAAIATSTPEIRLRFGALLQQLKDDPLLCDRLTQDHFGVRGLDPFEVRRWVQQNEQDNNLWRLRIWDFEALGLNYRVVYAFFPTESRYVFLAFAPREWNYDPDHALTRRILDDYHRIRN